MFSIKKRTAIIIIIAAFLVGCCLTWFVGRHFFSDNDNSTTPDDENTPSAPMEKNVNITMYCIEVNTGYEVLGNGQFSIKGTYSSDDGGVGTIVLNRLKILDLEMTGDNNGKLIVHPSLNVMDYEMWVGNIYFGGLSSVMIDISRWNGAAVIRVDDRMFIASTQNNFTPEAFRSAYQYLFADYFELFK